MRAVKYGATRDYVAAMTVVLPPARSSIWGPAWSKTSSGYSLLNLMIGSEGTLGIITELTLKLIPAPKEVISLVGALREPGGLHLHRAQADDGQPPPQALEFMEREIVRLSESYLGKSTFPQTFEGTDVNAYLLVTFDGENEDQLTEIIEQASEVVLEAGALDVLVADTPQLKKGRLGRPVHLPGGH